MARLAEPSGQAHSMKEKAVCMEGSDQKDGKKKGSGKKAIKRTNLATERTRLANERTFMAYGRTAFSMIIAGLSILEFFDAERYRWLGLSLIPIGVAVAILGLVRYLQKRRLIRDHSLDSYKQRYS